MKIFVRIYCSIKNGASQEFAVIFLHLLAKKGWQQSEIVPSMGYRYLYNDVQAVSAGIVAHLGLKDTNAPEINLW